MDLVGFNVTPLDASTISQQQACLFTQARQWISACKWNVSELQGWWCHCVGRLCWMSRELLCEKVGSISNVSNLYLGCAIFEFRLVHKHAWHAFCSFTQYLQGNAGIASQIRPRPLPFTSFPFHYFLISRCYKTQFHNTFHILVLYLKFATKLGSVPHLVLQFLHSWSYNVAVQISIATALTHQLT
jgi:hypothetical protein